MNERDISLAYERQTDAMLDDMNSYSHSVEQYTEKNADRIMLEWFNDDGIDAVIECLQETKHEIQSRKLMQYTKLHLERGKLNRPELAELGDAFIDWLLSAGKETIDEMAQREYDNKCDDGPDE